MVNVTFSKTYLFKLVGTKLDDKKLQMYVSKMGLELEGATKDDVSIELPANRPDLIDIVGFARALRNFLHKSKKLRYKLKATAPSITLDVGKGVKEVRPFISAMTVQGLKLDDQSLKHLLNFMEKFTSNYGRGRKKLAIGMHDLDKIKMPLVYDAVKDQEFEALGSKKAKFSQILKTHEKGIAYAGAIAGAKLYPVVSDKQGVISLVPILNSERTKVTSKSRNLFIEITGTNRYIVEKSLDLFAAMFIDMRGKIGPVRISYDSSTTTLPKMSSQTIEIPLLKIEQQIGVIIGFNNIISLANKMGYEAALVGRNIRFMVPEYRLDVLNEQDVIEDIAIAYGYDYIQTVPIFSEQAGALEDSTLREMKLSEILLGLGFSESMNSFLSGEKVNFESMRQKPPKEYIKLKGAKVQYLTMLRTALLPSLLKDLGMSSHDKMPQRLFEIDLAFNIDKQINETHNVAGAIVDPKANFNQIKAVVEGILQNMGMKYSIKETLHTSFIEGRSASIILEGKDVGVFGEVHPEVLNNFGIEEPTVAFEITL